MFVSVLFPSSVVTVVTYSPAGTVSVHVIFPESDTSSPSVAGSILYDTFLFVASTGVTVAVNCRLPATPALAVEVLGDKVTSVTETIEANVVNSEIGIFSDSSFHFTRTILNAPASYLVLDCRPARVIGFSLSATFSLPL